MSSVKMQVLVPATPCSSARLFHPRLAACPVAVPSDHFIHRVPSVAVFLWGPAPSASPQKGLSGILFGLPMGEQVAEVAPGLAHSSIY